MGASHNQLRISSPGGPRKWVSFSTDAAILLLGLVALGMVLRGSSGKCSSCIMMVRPDSFPMEEEFGPTHDAFKDPPYHGLLHAGLTRKYVKTYKFLPPFLPYASSYGKHFREAAWDSSGKHLDARYKRKLNHAELMEKLGMLYRAWSRFADSQLEGQGISYWLVHGTLMGWYWGGKIMSLDDDIDLQMPIQDLWALRSYNMTLIENRYLLEINPRVVHRWRERNNVIDARFIDTQNGLFIDITGLSFVGYDGSDAIVSCKSQPARIPPHTYKLHELLPLVETTFEGARAWVSNDYEKHLFKEYGEKYKKDAFKNWHFNKESRRWELVEQTAPSPGPTPGH